MLHTADDVKAMVEQLEKDRLFVNNVVKEVTRRFNEFNQRIQQFNNDMASTRDRLHDKETPLYLLMHKKEMRIEKEADEVIKKLTELKKVLEKKSPRIKNEDEYGTW